MMDLFCLLMVRFVFAQAMFCLVKGFEKATVTLVEPLGYDVTTLTSLPERLTMQIVTRDNETYTLPLVLNKRLWKEMPVYLEKTFGHIEQLTTPRKENVGHYQGKNGVFLLTFEGSHLKTTSGYFDSGMMSLVIQTYLDGHVMKRYHQIHNHLPTHGRRNDYQILPKNVSTTSRHKRQVQLYEIELFIVVDFSFYKEWLNQDLIDANNDSPVLDNLVHHFALLLNGVDSRFNSIRGSGYIVDVIPTGIFISQKFSSSPWSESIKQTSFPRPVISEESLKLFSEWLKRIPNIVSGFDHAIAFTAYDLMSKENQKTLGIGYKQSMCTDKSVSIVEHHGNIAYTSFIVAHELAHSLGAKHDGEPKTVKYGDQSVQCSTDDGFIMSPKATKSPDKNERSWEFSKCSLLYFDFLIDHLNANNTNCMSWFGNGNLTNAILSRDKEVYSPDEQCEHAHGTGSYMRRDVLDKGIHTICRSIPCSDTTRSGQFIATLSMEGTRCGIKKVCHLGDCVTYDNNEPSYPLVSDEWCLFGDQPGVVVDAKTCEDLIASPALAFHCYKYEMHCCHTCSKYRRQYSIRDLAATCYYGDQKAQCSTDDCNDLYCCETCAALDGTLKACQNMDTPLHGSMTFNTVQLYHGTIAIFSCNHGYNINGTGISICLENGTWNSTAPNCFRGCLAPPLNPHIILSPKETIYQIGAIINVSCLYGLKVQGDRTLKCQNDSTWGSNLPYCIMEYTSHPEIYTREDTLHALETVRASVEYELLYFSYPGISVTGTGSVIVDDGIDYESVRVIILIIKAVLNADKHINALQRLIVYVEDVNEFVPEFTLCQVCCSVIPPANTEFSIGAIARVSAKDGDIYDGNITYSLRGSAESTDVFQIDYRSGKITFLNSSFYRHPHTTDFTIDVLAVDTGQPALTGTCQIEVIIGQFCSVSNSLLPKPTICLFILIFSLNTCIT